MLRSIRNVKLLKYVSLICLSPLFVFYSSLYLFINVKRLSVSSINPSKNNGLSVRNIRNTRVFNLFSVDCKTVRIFLRSQVSASSQTKGLERGWKRRVRLGRDVGRVRLALLARVRLLRHALTISLLILRKKPTVLQSIFYAVLFITGHWSLLNSNIWIKVTKILIESSEHNWANISEAICPTMLVFSR